MTTLAMTAVIVSALFHASYNMLIKTSDEIDCLRQAGVITESAHWEVCQALRPGVTEWQMAGVAAKALFKLGAEEMEGPSFVICSGPRSGHSVPNMPTDRIVRPGDLFVIDIDTGELTQLTEGERDEYDPAWSPDGEWIAYVTQIGDQSDVFVMRADGIDQTNLTNSPYANDFQPIWTADSEQIIYVSYTTADGDRGIILNNVLHDCRRGIVATDTTTCSMIAVGDSEAHEHGALGFPLVKRHHMVR